MSEHSILAPSDAERWARCPGALHLSKGVPELDAEYNASGNCSHYILEQCLKNTIDPVHFRGKKLQFGIDPSTNAPFAFDIDDERCDRIRTVIEHIYREPGQMWVEKELNTSPIFGRPGQIGHADVIKLDLLGTVMINDQPHTGVLSVHDFKDGYIRVMAKDNLQGLSYGAAALYEMDLLGDIGVVRFCVHQPKIGHYDEWSYTRKEIETFVAAIAPTAQLAYDLYHETVEFDPKVHLIAGDAQCFWCPVRGSCPARAKRIVDLFAAVITGHEIDDEALSKIYMQLEEIEQACRDYRTEALRRATAGRTITGHKLVRGRMGAREYADPAQAEMALSLLLPEEQMYAPREIVSPTQLERRAKDAYKVMLPYIRQKPGAVHLAPVDDPRPAITVEPMVFTPPPPEEP